MSKIQSVNYPKQPKSAPKHGNYAYTQNFGLGLSDLPKGAQIILTKGVGERIDARTGWAGRKLKWLADWKGEKQTQLINALFTTTLAPVMIAYNPFAKQDEKTKKYTALRQPISAAIALAVALPITVKLDRFMDNLYHNGHFETIDLRVAPSKDTLTRAFYKNEKVGAFSRMWKFLKGEENPKLEQFIEDVQKERLDFFTTLITEDPKNITFDEASKAIMVNGKDIQAGQKIRVPGFETKAALDKYLRANNFHNRKFGDFLKERFGFEFYPNGELKPRVTETKLSTVKAMDFLKEIGLIDDKVNETSLRKMLGYFQQSRKIPNTAHIFRNAKLDPEAPGQLLEIIGKLQTRNTQVYVGEEFGKAKTTTLGQFLHQLEISLTPEKPNERSLEMVTKKSMNETLSDFKRILAGSQLDGFEKGAGINNYAKNMLKTSAKRMESYASNYKGYTGIIFNLVTTAVACTILNWAYPRIMERFFPHLTKSDKQPDAAKGGNK